MTCVWRGCALASRECGGTAYCKHNRRKQQCRDCGGSSICPHGRVKYKCRDCGGSMFCKHNRAKRNCKEGCGGTNICKHNKYKNRCKRCRLDAMCVHKVARKICPDCKPLREMDAAGVASKMHELLGAWCRCGVVCARHLTSLLSAPRHH